MTQASDDLTVRPIIGPDKLDLFCRIPYVLNAELAGDLQALRRRPEWLWVALRGDRLVARVGGGRSRRAETRTRWIFSTAKTSIPVCSCSRRRWWACPRRSTPLRAARLARVAGAMAYNSIIAYLGVVPGHRGRGYVDEILAEGTRILAAQGVPRIRAATDVGNVPMARAFARLGYATLEHQLDMKWG